MSNQLGLLQTRGFELRLQSLMLHDASRMLSQWRCDMMYGAAAAGLDSLLRRLELGLHGLPLFACRLQTHVGMAQHGTQHRKDHARICQDAGVLMVDGVGRQLPSAGSQCTSV